MRFPTVLELEEALRKANEEHFGPKCAEVLDGKSNQEHDAGVFCSFSGWGFYYIPNSRDFEYQLVFVDAAEFCQDGYNATKRYAVYHISKDRVDEAKAEHITLVYEADDFASTCAKFLENINQ